MNQARKRGWRRSKAPTCEPIQVEVAKEFKADARYFLRLDLGYLAATAVLVGVFKIAPNKIPEVVAEWWQIVIPYFALLAFDTATYTLAQEHWVAGKLGRLTRLPPWLLSGAIRHQAFLHFCFILFLVGGALGYSTGMHHGLELRSTRIELQSEIDSFFGSEKHYPISLKELEEKRPAAKTTIRHLEGELFDYAPIGDKSYRLRFALQDDINNAIVLTPEINLEKITKEIDKEDSSRN